MVPEFQEDKSRSCKALLYLAHPIGQSTLSRLASRFREWENRFPFLLWSVENPHYKWTLTQKVWFTGGIIVMTYHSLCLGPLMHLCPQSYVCVHSPPKPSQSLTPPQHQAWSHRSYYLYQIRVWMWLPWYTSSWSRDPWTKKTNYLPDPYPTCNSETMTR